MNDRTVLLVAQPEAVDDDGSGADRVRVVLDRLLVWQGSRAATVGLDDVTETALTLSRELRAPVIYDPHRAAQLSQQLRAAMCWPRRITATVALASIDSGNAERDAYLRAAELLDVEHRPTMSYRSTQVRGEDTARTGDGDLTIGDVTGPLTLAVELRGVEDFFGGTRHAGFEATGEIRRKVFGLGLLGAAGRCRED